LDGAVPRITHKHAFSNGLLLPQPHRHLDLAVFARLPAQHASILAPYNILVLKFYFWPAGQQAYNSAGSLSIWWLHMVATLSMWLAQAVTALRALDVKLDVIAIAMFLLTHTAVLG
jgi:hypothetical protein